MLELLDYFFSSHKNNFNFSIVCWRGSGYGELVGDFDIIAPDPDH